MRLFKLFFLLSIAFHSVNAQWVQSRNLLGGTIISDIIEYKGALYAASHEHGIYKSTDNGESWVQVEQISNGSAIIVFELHNDELWAGVHQQLTKTSNGDTWNKISGPGGVIFDMASNGTTIYLATHLGIYKSDDNGATWIDINDSNTSRSISSVVVSGSTIFTNGESGILFKSVNGGLTWARIPVQGNITEVILRENDIYINTVDAILKSSNQGINWTNITSSLGSFNSIGKIKLDGARLIINNRNSVLVTENEGSTWVDRTNNRPYFSISTICATQNFVYLGTWGGGIFRNNKAMNQDWQSKKSSMAFVAINDLLANDTTILVSTELNFLRSSKDEGETWDQKIDAFNFPGISSTSVISAGAYFFAGTASGVYRSDDGITLKLMNNGLTNKQVVDLASNGKNVFAAMSDGLFKTEDYGSNWKRVSNFGTNLRSIAAEKSRIVLSTWDGLFFSENNGDTWSKISSGLPSQSINCMQFAEDEIYVAPQSGGVYKTSNKGASWTKVNNETVYSVGYYKGCIVLGAWPKVFVSNDLGATWLDLSNGLPYSIMIAVDFTDEHVIVGTRQPGNGIWKRPNHQVMPPHFSFRSAYSDSLFIINNSLMIESDQDLRTMNGIVLTSEALVGIISIRNSHGQAVNFSALVKSDKLIEVTITGAVKNERYAITVDKMKNVSGFISKVTTSQSFRAIENSRPVLADIHITETNNKSISLSNVLFKNAFTDQDQDALTYVKIQSLPEHGKLKFNNTDVLVNDVFPIGEIGQLKYVNDIDFTGSVQFDWNGSDGKEYALQAATVILDLVTGIMEEADLGIQIYPNPFSTGLTINFKNDVIGQHHVKLMHLSGAQLTDYSFVKTGPENKVRIDLQNVAQGFYLLIINSPRFQVQRKILKK